MTGSRMNLRFTKWIGRSFPILALSFVLFLTGCIALLAGAGGGATTYSYVKGELLQDYPASLDETYNASIAALEHLELILIDMKKDKLGATIQARRTDDTKITLKLETLGTEETRVGIRVGIFGDQDASRRINGEILRALGR